MKSGQLISESGMKTEHTSSWNQHVKSTNKKKKWKLGDKRRPVHFNRLSLDKSVILAFKTMIFVANCLQWITTNCPFQKTNDHYNSDEISTIFLFKAKQILSHQKYKWKKMPKKGKKERNNHKTVTRKITKTIIYLFEIVCERTVPNEMVMHSRNYIYHSIL